MENPIDYEKLLKTSHSLVHRGPDDSGIYQNQTRDHCIALVHCRLSILDLDPRSAQPFRLGNQILCYNGEIYNYVEIRQELKTLGHAFKTSGDTEVLAIALKEWGPMALEKLEGMWAFAWFDEEADSLMLSRDPFGEKPLYFYETGESVYFAQNLRAFLL